MDYFLIRCIYNSQEFYSVWHTGDTDGLCCADKKILSFPDMNSVHQYMLLNAISLNSDSDIPIYNFDELTNWLSSNSNEVHCNEMLNFWNMFTDAATTTELTYIGDKKTKAISSIYDKLFFGCNSRITKWLLDSDENYMPAWNNKQISLLKSILKNGLNLFINNLTVYTAV